MYSSLLIIKIHIMKSIFGVLGTIAGFIQCILTFMVLLELKGLFFTMVSIFIFPVFAFFPVWGYFLWGYFNPILFGSFLTLVVGGLVEATYRD